MSFSRILAILALVVQAGNAIGGFLEAWKPGIALVVAGAVGAIQAFLEKIQGPKQNEQ